MPAAASAGSRPSRATRAFLRTLLRTQTIRTALLTIALAGALACASEPADTVAHRVRTIDGFAQPESVRYDPDLDVFYVSSMAGFGSARDGFGYISRVDATEAGRIEHFIRSGHNGVQLNAPKGMALQGDTLWVGDIDLLRGFDRRTGAPLALIDLRPHGAVLINDLAAGPQGALYATDSGILMSPVGVIYTTGQKIFRVDPRGSRVTVVASDTLLGHPNGITWDSAAARWVVVNFHGVRSEAYTLNLDGGERTVLARGSGRFDGVEALDDGRLLFTAWSDSSLHLLEDGEDRRIVRNLWQPADLGVDTRRGRVAIPLVLQGRVEIWTIPRR